MFGNNTNLIFDGVDNRISKKEKPYRMAKFIDTVNYQRISMFLDEDAQITATEGKPCKLTFGVRVNGFNNFWSASKVESLQSN